MKTTDRDVTRAAETLVNLVQDITAATLTAMNFKQAKPLTTDQMRAVMQMIGLAYVTSVGLAVDVVTGEVDIQALRVNDEVPQAFKEAFE